MFTVLAVMVPLFIGTFGMSDVIYFHMFLLIAGIIMTSYVNKKFEYDENIDDTEATNILMATVAGIVFIGVIAVTTTSFSLFKFPSWAAVAASTMSVTDRKMTAALMAVSEEHFFRGFLTNLFNWKLGSPLGSVTSATIGTIYHFRRYGSDISSLVFIFAAFFILSMIATRTKRISPTILTHVIHNVVVA